MIYPEGQRPNPVPHSPKVSAKPPEATTWYGTKAADLSAGAQAGVSPWYGVYPRWLRLLSRADFLKSAGLYAMRDRLFLVRLRKDLLRLSVIEKEVSEVAMREDVPRRQALSDALRSLLAHFDPGRDPLYLCLSPDQTMSCQLFLPQVAEENLPQVLEYEIERYLPLRREEIYYDFLPLGRRGDKVGVLLFAVPRKILDEMLDVLSALGVRPRGVEVSATALVNYLLFCAGGVAGPAAILGSHNQGWEIIGLQGRADIWGQKAEILFSHWLPQADWVRGPGAELFHKFLSQSPRLFGWGYLQDLLLAVQGDKLQLEELLALGKKGWGADDGFDPPSINSGPEPVEGSSAEGISHALFVPAFGTALRGLREAAFSVNLLPGASPEGPGRLFSRLNVLLAVLLLIGLIVWGGSYPLRDEIRLRRMQQEIEKFAPSVEALRQEEDRLRALTKELAFLSEVRGRRAEVLLVLDELSRVVPPTAYLSNLRYRGENVELQGSAENASNLVPLLERSPAFKNVGFNAPSNRGRDNRETFSLKAEMERPQQKVKP